MQLNDASYLHYFNRHKRRKLFTLFVITIVIGFIIIINILVQSYNYRLKILNTIKYFDSANVFVSEMAKRSKILSSDYRNRTHDRLFAWIMTYSRNHATLVPAINATWPQRFDHYLFYTDEYMHNNYPYAKVFHNIDSHRRYLWPKTRLALKFTSDRYGHDYDWYLKADDDTFIIVENLRNFLINYDPNQMYFFGFRMRQHLINGYNSGGGGYVLSRGALKLFADKLYSNASVCPPMIAIVDAEDVQLADCLAQYNVYPGDTRDRDGKFRFLPYRIDEFIQTVENGDDKLWFYDQADQDFAAFSRELISIHHLSAHEIRLYDMLIYGINH